MSFAFLQQEWLTKSSIFIMAPLLKIFHWLHIALEINFRLFNINYKAFWIPFTLIYVALSLARHPGMLVTLACYRKA